MARPKKSPADLRTGHIAFCVSPAEQTRILSLASKANLTKAEFVRASALGKKMVVQKSTAPDFMTRNELRRIGVNLNQIARAVNDGFAPPAKLNELIEKLDHLFDQWIDYGSQHRPSGP